MTEPTPQAWWVRDRPAPSRSGVEGAPDAGAHGPGTQAVAVTTRLPEGSGPPDLVLIQAGPAARPAARPVARPAARTVAPAGDRDRRPALLGAAAGAGVLLLALASWGLFTALRPDRSDRPGTNTGTGTGVAVRPVDPAGVTASASSTQRSDGGISYAAANTLDGDPSTAWNSDGAHDGKGPGMALTYTFAAPIELRSVSVLNGYQKLRQRAGKAPIDLYPVNERLRRVKVITDAGAWTWDLTDSRERQTLSTLTGSTRRLRLEVVSVYPSTTYTDLAVSEVSFTAAATATATATAATATTTAG